MNKVEEVIEHRIEKQLDLIEEIPEKSVQILNTKDGNVPTINNNHVHSENDFQYARENLYDIIEKGRDAMGELLEIAKSEESPRAFEVFGQLLKNMADTQETLMELHQKKQKLENNDERHEVSKAQNVTNALFVGSTADLLKMIKKETKK